jgi:hypothetical protein
LYYKINKITKREKKLLIYTIMNTITLNTNLTLRVLCLRQRSGFALFRANDFGW